MVDRRPHREARRVSRRARARSGLVRQAERVRVAHRRRQRRRRRRRLRGRGRRLRRRSPGDHRRHRGRTASPTRSSPTPSPSSRSRGTRTRWLRRSLSALPRQRPPTSTYRASSARVGSRLRQPLTDDDVERYRELGREAAAAVETVCRNLEPEDPEYEVAAGIDISLASRDDVDTRSSSSAALSAPSATATTPRVTRRSATTRSCPSPPSGAASTPRSPEPSRSTPPTG